jgi:hypothetical protein
MSRGNRSNRGPQQQQPTPDQATAPTTAETAPEENSADATTATEEPTVQQHQELSPPTEPSAGDGDAAAPAASDTSPAPNTPGASEESAAAPAAPAEATETTPPATAESVWLPPDDQPLTAKDIAAIETGTPDPEQFHAAMINDELTKPEQKPVTMQDVLYGLDADPSEPEGYVQRRPEVRLSHDEAVLQARIYRILDQRGVKLRSQAQVYGWILSELLRYEREMREGD